MDLSRILLACAIVQAFVAVGVARYRRDGTVVDVLIGAFAAGCFFIFAAVILTITNGLDFFGVVHLTYLSLVVTIPVAALLLAAPHWRDVEYRTPLLMVALTGIAFLLIGIGVWATHIEPWRLRVDELGLGATGVAQPFVVGVLADLQTTSIGEHEQAAVDMIVAGEPNFILIPGDVSQFERPMTAAEKGEFIGLLRQLTESAELVAIVPGNTDLLSDLQEIATSIGALLLTDDFVSANVAGQEITIVGIDEPVGNEIIDDAMLDRIGTLTEDQIVVATSHRPDPILLFGEDLAVDLFVAGHTHGGQVSLPFIGPVLTASDIPKEVASGGLHLVNGHPTYISTGVGLERGQAPQIRFGVRPSVALITIVPS